MKIQFETPEEFESLRLAAHDGILYWKKIRQMCQGKININVDGSETHYDEQYAVDMMISHAKVLREIELMPHPEWNEKTGNYEMAIDIEMSNLVEKTLKLIPRTEVNY